MMKPDNTKRAGITSEYLPIYVVFENTNFVVVISDGLLKTEKSHIFKNW